MSRRVFVGARLYTGDAVLDGHALVVEGGRIDAVVPAGRAPQGAFVERLPEGSALAPGFVDVQVNGAGGVLFNEAPTSAGAQAIAAALRPRGTTSILPTFITDDRATMRRACAGALEALSVAGSGIAGLHLEGPFLGPARAGVHDPLHLRAPDAADLDELVALSAALRAQGGRLLLTIAPERVDDGALVRLREAGVVLAAGHTAASFERTEEALRAGVRGFTHLFNAMPPIVNRDPGPALAALISRDAWCSVIVDGHHVHPALLRLAASRKRPGGLFLVSDAMPCVGTGDTSFSLYGKTVHRKGGTLVTDDGTLAGADLDLAEAVRQVVALMGLPLDEALRMASLYPAAALGLDHDRGRLAPGHRADLALLLADGSVGGAWIAGERV